ncbi:MAG: hypothetical protein AB9873_03075 [Syntrophobacteraceae bacterium]
MKNPKGSRLCSVLMLVMSLGCVACATSSDVHAGGVHFGFGVDVPIPGTSAPPPAVVYPPPVVVERVPVPPPVVVRQTPPPVVYEGPVVVERRSTLYYYAPSYDPRARHEETEREYYRQRTRSWDDNDLY